MSDTQGYLVVLSSPGDANILSPSQNTRYMGIGRLPPWPSGNPSEDPIWEDFVLHLRGDGAFLPSLSDAIELLKRLNLVSNRHFDIIECKVAENTDSVDCKAQKGNFLGYDVVSLGDYWSFVSRFPYSPSNVEEYLTLLNENGLFSSLRDASSYIKKYCDSNYVNYDSSIEIFSICQIISDI